MSRQEFKWLFIVFGLAITICWLDYYWQKNRPGRSPKLVDPTSQIRPTVKGHHIVVLHDPNIPLSKDIRSDNSTPGVYVTTILIRDEKEYDRAVQRAYDAVHDQKRTPIDKPD